MSNPSRRQAKQTQSRPQTRLRRWRPALERLEDRLAPATLTVDSDQDNTTDDTLLTLREAILLVNNAGNANAALGRALNAGEADNISGAFGSNDTITFDPTLTAGGDATINLTILGEHENGVGGRGDSALVIGTTMNILGPAGPNRIILNGPGNTGDVDTSMRLFLVTSGGNLTLDHLTLSGGRADGNSAGLERRGGAILNQLGVLTVTNSTIDGNTAVSNGGAIHNLGTATIIASTFRNNSVSNGSGGAIYNDGTGDGFQILNVTNSTFSGNSASSSGGAIFNDTTDSFGDNTILTLVNSTLTANHAPGGTGGGLAANGTEIVHNTIVAGNDAATEFEISGTVGTGTHNLVGFSGQGGLLAADGNILLTPAETSDLGNSILNPTLADNGGPTRTHALIADAANPALDAGDDAVPSEVQTIAVTLDVGAITGTFTITFGGQTTAAMAFDAAPATVEMELNNLSSIGGVGGSVVVAGAPGNYTVGFGGSFGNQNLPPMTAAGAGGAGAEVVPVRNGETLTTDQRGGPFSRVDGVVDIGAFELQTNFVVTTLDDELDPDAEFSAADLSLREAIALAEAEPGHQTITFDPVLFTLMPRTIDLSIIGNDDATNGDSAFLITTEIIIQGPTGPNGLTLEGPGNTGNVDTTMRLFLVAASGNLTLDHLTMTGGVADGDNDANDGGAIANDGTLSIQNSTLSGNSAGLDGGGVDNAGTLVIQNSTLSGNSAGLDGGGVDNAGTLTVQNSTLSGNSASANGGGIFNSGGTLTVQNSTLSGNSAEVGGGIFNSSGTLTVQNSTLSGNSAVLGGGGIANFGGGTLTIQNSTLSGNSADVGPGGVDLFGSNNTLSNSIVAGNFSGPTSDPADINGSVDTDNSFNNLIGTGGSGGLIHGDNGNQVGVDVATVLDTTLADNGGPTLTHRLILNSPAINAGDPAFTPPPDFDQRGLPRVQGGRVDIGSYETQPPAIVTGTNKGAPEIAVFDAAGNELIRFLAFPTGKGGVRVATGDVTGDGIPDIIAGAGPGRQSFVRVFDGVTFEQVDEFQAFGKFKGGVFVAAGYINDDPFADIIVGKGKGSPRVKVFSGEDGSLLSTFKAYQLPPGVPPSPRLGGGSAPPPGGVTVAAADIDHDGFAEIITGSGVGVVGRVRIFSGDGAFLQSFKPFGNFKGGIFVAAGDIDCDCVAEVLVGRGKGKSLASLFTADGDPLASAEAYPGTKGGVRVAMLDRDGDGQTDELLTSPGPGTTPDVIRFDTALNPIDDFAAYDALFTGGVFVAGS